MGACCLHDPHPFDRVTCPDRGAVGGVVAAWRGVRRDRRILGSVGAGGSEVCRHRQFLNNAVSRAKDIRRQNTGTTFMSTP